MILVDTNVLIDVLANDPDWAEWSETKRLQLIATDELAINPIISAEIAVAYPTKSALEKALRIGPLIKLPFPYEAGFISGQAFKAYRQRGGKNGLPGLTSIAVPTLKPNDGNSSLETRLVTRLTFRK
jgi:predicted nucleic acid-binding protein